MIGLAAACSPPTAGPTPEGTRPGVTLIAPPAATATPPPPAPTDTPVPPIGLPQPTATAPCTDDATFVSDVSVPDGTQFKPGDPIDKIWTVQNTGTCDWGADYRLVHVRGEAMGAPTEMGLYPAVSGAEATIRVQMTAPAEPGEHVGRWQARSPDGDLFGSVVFIKIVVVPPEGQ